jgi:hypothetical protein
MNRRFARLIFVAGRDVEAEHHAAGDIVRDVAHLIVFIPRYVHTVGVSHPNCVSYSTGIPWRIVFSVTTRGSTNWSR